MARQLLNCLALTGLYFSSSSALPFDRRDYPSTDSVKVHWIDGTPDYNPGTTFGLPWPEGKFYPNDTKFTVSSGSPNAEETLGTWVTGYWRDGSIKWTGHSLPPSSIIHDQYTVKPVHSTKIESRKINGTAKVNIKVKDNGGDYIVDTGKIAVVFPKSGNSIVRSIKTSNGTTVGENGRLVLHTQNKLVDASDLPGADINYDSFESKIGNVSITSDNVSRALVTVQGKHHVVSGKHKDWLPFVVRFYLYSNSESIRIMHSIVFDGDHESDFIRGLGIRFDVPLKGEQLYNRHIRLPGVDDGYLHESVHGITGLRRDPGKDVRHAQFKGKKTPDVKTWDTRVSSRLHWIPTWNDYQLNQLSPDGFTLRKRTKKGQGWVNIPGGTRSHGFAYLGGATKGGLALGLRDFWKRHPSGIEISNASNDHGQLTLWLYNPEASPLDLRPFHDDMNMTTYKKQLDALEITYEDYEPKFNTPYGISRSSEVFLYAFDATPPAEHLAKLSKHMNLPPALAAEPAYIKDTHAAGSYWGTYSNSTQKAETIEKHLDFLINFYKKQVDYRRWYGFLDYGDVMHTYDEDRHMWRYDVGGYAWDNSELSSDMWLWQYFLHTGRADVYRFAEAMLRHTSEVDVYHTGKWKGLGTRHSVQHFSDSGKQVRISQPQYRKYFYFLSGGDERVGELMAETLDSDKTFDILDDQRKVRPDDWKPKPGEPASITLGTDWSSLAAGWFIEWERRGPRWEEAREKLTNSAASIANLTNGFITGLAMLNIPNGTLLPPPGDPDNKGYVSVNQLNAVFGLLEVVSEMLDYWGDDAPKGFADAFLQYCEYYHTSAAIQNATFGSSWTKNSLYQGHSRLEAYYAMQKNNQTMAKKAWSDFWNPDDTLDFNTSTPFNSTHVGGSDVLLPVEEATWLSTNAAAQYGLAAIQNLQMIGKWIDQA